MAATVYFRHPSSTLCECPVEQSQKHPYVAIVGPWVHSALHLTLVSSAGHSLLVHMEDSPAGTLQLTLASKSASFIPYTVNATCTLLFALRVA